MYAGSVRSALEGRMTLTRLSEKIARTTKLKELGSRQRKDGLGAEIEAKGTRLSPHSATMFDRVGLRFADVLYDVTSNVRGVYDVFNARAGRLVSDVVRSNDLRPRTSDFQPVPE